MQCKPSISFYILLLFCSYLFIQKSSHAQSQNIALQKGIQLINIAKEKSDNYAEVDSIYFYITEAKKIFHQIGHDSMIYECNDQLVFWHTLEKEFQEAYLLNKENEKFAIQNHDNFLLMRTYLSYVNLYRPLYQHEPDSSLKYAHLSYNIAKKLNNPLHIIISQQSKINNYLEIPDSLFLIPKLSKEIFSHEKTDKQTKYMSKMTYVDMGRYYLKIADYKNAIKYLEPQSELKSNNYDYGFTKWALELLSEAYAKNREFEKAFITAKKMQVVSDSISSTKKLEAIQKARHAYDTEQKEILISQLEEMNKLKEQAALRQKSFLWAIIIGFSAITGLIGLLLWNMNKKRKSDQQLIAYQNEMTQTKSKLFTNITHEFRTPLTVILGMANQIKGNNKEKNLIKRNGQQLLSLVNQVLDLSKVEAGLLKANYIQSNIITYLEYIVESFLALAQKKDIRLFFHSDESELLMDFDEEKIKHICTNLISNAIKFTPNKGKIIIIAEKKENQFFIRVKDSGIGISENDLPKIFDRFYQSESQQNEGTGIGLALTKELTELMEGNISVKSELNKGSEFIINLPINNNAPFKSPFTDDILKEKLKTNNNYIPIGNFHQNDKIALIIDDNEDVLTYIESCLTKNYKIEKAIDGEEGLKKAMELIPDIIISDVMMPNMNGYDFTAAIKKDLKTCHVPVILLTAKATQEEKIEGLQTGADAYLIKPFHEEELQIRMRQLIQLRANLQQKYQTDLTIKKEPARTDPFFEKILEVLENNFSDENFGVKELSHSLHLSRMQVHRKIKALANMTTTELINNFRLEKALDLLKDPNLNISEIAYQVGFNNPSYFSRLFSEKYEQAPSEMRGSSQ